MTEIPDPATTPTDPPASPAPDEPATPARPIVAKPSMDYRLRRYAISLILIVFGGFSIKDGFYVYPRDNRADVAAGKTPRHSEFDIPLNKYLGILLPPIGLAWAIWTTYQSRGKYVFDGETLDVPGHPPVPLQAVRQIDRTLWDRKGIAKLKYELSAGDSGELTLDDFIYNRKATDQIFETIEKALTPPTA